jgi:ATP-dependent Lon protease
MEVIELPGYLEHDKLEIAKQHVIPELLAAHGLPAGNVTFTDDAILKIIRNYTEEAGVRELVRKIAKTCRKVARILVTEAAAKKANPPEISKDKNPLSGVGVTEEGKLEPSPTKIILDAGISIEVNEAKIEEYLGVPKYRTSKKELEPKIGAVMGLAWTSTGGDVLPVEVTVMTGSEKLSLTGQLGDVMKESAQASLSYIRSRSTELGLKPNFMKEKEIHIHLPEGAVPKDGPSAGITLTMAMLSALTGKQVRGDLAMTGEITLRGNVLPIGGLQEKLLAAQREGIKCVLIPEENRKSLVEIPKKILEGLNIIPIERIGQAIPIVFDLKTDAKDLKLVEKPVKKTVKSAKKK